MLSLLGKKKQKTFASSPLPACTYTSQTCELRLSTADTSDTITATESVGGGARQHSVFAAVAAAAAGAPPAAVRSLFPSF